VPGRYVFACRIPFLPDLRADGRAGDGLSNPRIEAYARQIGLLRALAAHAAGSCALQLRFVANQATEGPVQMALLGVAQGIDQAFDLLDLVRSLMPSDVPLDVVADPAEVAAVWFPLGQAHRFRAEDFAEIRRALEPVDTDPSASRWEYDFVLLNWGWSAHSLTSSLELMQQQRGTTVLAVTVQPAWVHHEVYEYLTRGVREFQKALKGEWENPLLQTARGVYFDRARRLRQAALRLRVFLASDQPLLAGAPEFFGADLSRRSDSSGLQPQSFEVVRPTTPAEADAADAMLYRLESPQWGFPQDVDETLQELIFLMDPSEAHTAFRIPLTPAGGLAGLATERAVSFSRGHQTRPQQATEQIVLGTSPALGPFGLTTDDVNEHVLVAGVPGSGKSTTVRTLLRALHARGVPFLVLDPAKTDYRTLADIATVMELDPDAVAFNPLAVPPGASVRGHQSRVLAALDSGLRLSERWPFARVVAALALSAAYSAAGVSGRATAEMSWPTVADLYRFTRAVIREQGLTGDALANVQAGLLSRLEYLVDGPLGDILSGTEDAAINWPQLTKQSTVIEMRNVTGTDERNLVFGFLFGALVAYREAHPLDRLGHVTVLEEAHRILPATDAASYATTIFSEAVAELRGSGEGFIVVDQAPSMLVSSVAKYTGSKIAHRLLDSSERGFMAESMVLSGSQAEDLARLARGRAIVHAGSLSDAVLVEVSPGKLNKRAELEGRTADIGVAVAAPLAKLTENSSVAQPWCSQCPLPCTAQPAASDRQLVQQFAPADPFSERAMLPTFVTAAARELGIPPSSGIIDRDMQLYCVSARVLVDSQRRDHRERNLLLRLHRDAWRAYIRTPATNKADGVALEN
jgi:energy-coupling factor transporter ATP-binding protein EcfA2